MPTPTPTPKITLLSTLTPPNPSRAWLTAPHPTLPLLATCSSDKTVRIYSLTTSTLLSTITGGHKRSIRTCAWKPNLKGESVLATGSFDASVGIWRHFDEGEMVPRPEASEVDLTGGAGGDNADEDESEEWRFAIVLDGHESEVKSVSWSAGGNLLATCSRDKSVWIWEEVGDDDYETVAVLQEHEGDVKCVAWHPEEELLASGSYDDEVRLWREDVDDWGCCGVLRGHDSTVWCVQWEGVGARIYGEGGRELGKRWIERREKAGPRLLSCSDDRTIRVWRRRPKERVQQSKLSIIRSGSSEEDWNEESRLPNVHTRTIYAVAWAKDGRVVSTGGDGNVVVYEERWKNPHFEAHSNRAPASTDSLQQTETGEIPQENRAGPMDGVEGTERTTKPADGQEESPTVEDAESEATEWVVIAQIEGAHGAFEVNHVAWAPRPTGKDQGNAANLGELIVTTGDDGGVKVWSLDI